MFSSFADVHPEQPIYDNLPNLPTKSRVRRSFVDELDGADEGMIEDMLAKAAKVTSEKKKKEKKSSKKSKEKDKDKDKDKEKVRVTLSANFIDK